MGILPVIYLASEVHGLPNSASIHTAPPIYFWIVDATSAIFSIPSYTDFTREQGFQTSDARLIASLQGIWKRMAQQTTGSPLKNADDTSKAA